MRTKGDGGPATDRRDATALLTLSAGLRRATDSGSVLDATVTALAEALDVHDGAIFIGRSADELRLDAVTPMLVVGAPLLAGLAASAARHGELTISEDAAAAPLVALGLPIGVLVVTSRSPDELTSGAAPLLESVAVQAAAAIESTRRFQEVMELERLKLDFINRVSHELRTPITIISGFLSTLLAHEGQVDVAQQRHMLERSLVASDRLARLIEDLLVLSRLEAGVLTPTIEKLRVADIATAAVAHIGAGDVVTVDIDRGVRATADSEMLERALTFVIDNAVKYAGAAWVTASPDAARGTVAIDVRDEGPGVEPSVRATIFEMFTRGPGATEVPGLGVGLPVARTLLEVLGATIEVLDPPEGPGTLVRIQTAS